MRPRRKGEKMEIFKRRPKFTYSFCAVCMQIIKENASDVNASYSTAAAEVVYIRLYKVA